MTPPPNLDDELRGVEDVPVVISISSAESNSSLTMSITGDTVIKPYTPSPLRAVPSWFSSNGCSNVPDHGIHTRTLCREHDWAYWIGGTKADKAAADKALRDGILAIGGPHRWLRGWLWYLGLSRVFAFASNRNFYWDKTRARHGFTYDTLRIIYFSERWV